MGRDPQRFFNWAQKNEIFNRANGKCESCKAFLSDGWHAHHKIRWADGGRTGTLNGMALCKDCHIKIEKDYIEMNQDSFIPRKPQEEMMTAFIQLMAEAPEKRTGPPPVLCALLACGSGKTVAALACCNLAFREGFARGGIMLNPRTALCSQYEESWDRTGTDETEGGAYTDFSQFFINPKMGTVRARKNEQPVLFEDQFGYSITYSALVSDLKKPKSQQIHLTETGIIQRPFILVLDEAQSLGFSAYDDDFFTDKRETRAYTEAVMKLYNHPNCVAAILMTATDVRSDSLPLFLGKYSEEDEKGRRWLMPDVRFSYVDGVTLKYLRPFDFHLEAAKVTTSRQFFDDDLPDKEESHLSKTSTKKLKRFIEQPQVWQILARKTVDRLLHVREALWDGYQGLIAAMDIKHAGQISAYLENQYPNIKCITVVGDLSKIKEDDAGRLSKNLKEFKRGNYDILISVKKAYVGFNHPRITVVGVLTHWRHFSFLEQLCGRGGRVYKNRPTEEQVLWVVSLDDKRMKDFADYMRKATVQYIKEKGEGDPPPEQSSFETVESVTLLGSSGEGFIEEGTLETGIHEPFSSLLVENNIAAAPTFVAGIVRRAGGSIEQLLNGKTASGPTTTLPQKDAVELRTEIESKIKSLAGYIARREGRDWLSVKMDLNGSLFPGKIENHWKKFRTEEGYIADLVNIYAMLESRIENEQRLTYEPQQR